MGIYFPKESIVHTLKRLQPPAVQYLGHKENAEKGRGLMNLRDSTKTGLCCSGGVARICYNPNGRESSNCLGAQFCFFACVPKLGHLLVSLTLLWGLHLMSHSVARWTNTLSPVAPIHTDKRANVFAISILANTHMSLSCSDGQQFN